ncbi:hypothetical protein BDZ97DRAFT_1923133 [Flammula alnicola]|nr:hypothetical protein BDZ97DRAFT_1923133 [Flammula alnicola]
MADSPGANSVGHRHERTISRGGPSTFEIRICRRRSRMKSSLRKRPHIHHARTILTITTPTRTLSPDACFIFRILLGIGIGGGHPMSASITSDRANLRKYGMMLAYIFSNQGRGNFISSLATIIVLLCYKHVTNVEGES